MNIISLLYFPNNSTWYINLAFLMSIISTSHACILIQYQPRMECNSGSLWICFVCCDNFSYYRYCFCFSTVPYQLMPKKINLSLLLIFPIWCHLLYVTRTLGNQRSTSLVHSFCLFCAFNFLLQLNLWGRQRCCISLTCVCSHLSVLHGYHFHLKPMWIESDCNPTHTRVPVVHHCVCAA